MGFMFARQLLNALDDRFPQYQVAFPDYISTFLNARFKNILLDNESVACIIGHLNVQAAEMISRCLSEATVLRSSSINHAVQQPEGPCPSNAVVKTTVSPSTSMNHAIQQPQSPGPSNAVANANI